MRIRERIDPATDARSKTNGAGGGDFCCTHDLSEQNDILTADEEETDPLFGEQVLMVYPLDRVFQNQIGYTTGEERRHHEK